MSRSNLWLFVLFIIFCAFRFMITLATATIVPLDPSRDENDQRAHNDHCYDKPVHGAAEGTDFLTAHRNGTARSCTTKQNPTTAAIEWS
jgi:hypothetical protein